MQQNNSERPISSRAEDSLGRAPFVERLVQSLVDAETHRGTGAVIGVTGPWGSGKSSLLNLIDEEINERFDDAVVVRFDPWLISGRGDLITLFLSELKAAIAYKPRAAAQLRSFTSTLTKYGALLAPSANLIIPTLGSALEGGFKAVNQAVTSEASLHRERASLKEHLSEVTVPIVVLIDEVDRLEDDEVISLAQLVKSVVDLPHISFVLAYDVDRVIQALGRKSNERGRSYLEKIVSLQVPIPIQLAGERRVVLRKGILDLGLAEYSHERNFNNPRYVEIEGILLRDVITTPRDIKRLVGAFGVLHRMMDEEEVHSPDILGYAALVTKFPQTVEKLKREGERVVIDPIDSVVIRERYGLKREQLSALAESFVGENAPEGALRLFRALFPLTRVAGEEGRVSVANSVAKRRPLYSLMRLGMLPGGVSAEEAKRALGLGISKTESVLRSHAEANSLGALIDRIEAVYHLKPKVDRTAFWRGAANFVASTNSATGWSERTMVANALEDLANIPFLASSRQPDIRATLSETTRHLVESDEFHIAPTILRQHFAPQQLFGHSGGTVERQFLKAEDTAKLATALAEKVRGVILAGGFWGSAVSFDAIWLLQALKLWGKPEIAAFEEFYSSAQGAEHLAFILARTPSGANPHRIQSLSMNRRFNVFIRERLGEISPHNQAVRIALKSLGEALPTI